MIRLGILTYVTISIFTFGIAASGESECDTKARDIAKCRATGAMAAALGWPLYASWVIAENLRDGVIAEAGE